MTTHPNPDPLRSALKLARGYVERAYWRSSGDEMSAECAGRDLAQIDAALASPQGRETVIEECAKFVEQHQERISETSNGSERSLSKRMAGNQMGLAYVDGLRALKSSAPDA